MDCRFLATMTAFFYSEWCLLNSYLGILGIIVSLEISNNNLRIFSKIDNGLEDMKKPQDLDAIDKECE